MPTYTYTARDQRGQQSSGQLDAESEGVAASRLRADGLWVTDLRAVGGKSPVVDRPEASTDASVEDDFWKRVFSPVSQKDLSLFYRQLHAMLVAGIGVYHAMTTLAGPNQTPSPELRRVAGVMAQDMLEGGRLSATMQKFPWLFDRMQVRMVEAGEAGGLLVDILERLAEYTERDHNLRMEVKRRTLYPKILLAALIFIPAVPTLVLSGFGPFAAEVMRTGGLAVIVAVGIWLLLRMFAKTEAGRVTIDQVKLAIPVVGPLVRKLAAARFARTLAALYGAGVPIASSLGYAGEACGNHLLEAASRRMKPALEHGNSISQTLASSRFFPPMFVGMVATGETTGSLDQSLNKAAEYYENEALHATVQLTVIMGVALLLAAGIMIGMKVIGAWTGHYGGVMGAGQGE